MKRILLAAAALLFGAGAAFAADIYSGASSKDPVTGNGYSPQGFYSFVGVGGGVTDTKLSGNAVVLPGDFGFSGFSSTVGAGYDFRVGNWVYGPLARISFDDIKGSIGSLTTTQSLANQNIGFELGARLGYVVNNSSLVYGKASWVDQHIGLNNTGFGTDLSGYALGMGLEIDMKGLVGHSGVFFFSEADWRGYGDWSPKHGVNLSEQGVHVMAGVGLRW